MFQLQRRAHNKLKFARFIIKPYNFSQLLESLSFKHYFIIVKQVYPFFFLGSSKNASTASIALLLLQLLPLASSLSREKR